MRSSGSTSGRLTHSSHWSRCAGIGVRIGAARQVVKVLACALLGAGCAPTSNPLTASSAFTPEPVVLYVSPRGRDDQPGTAEAPIRGLGSALERADVVRLLPGVHRAREVLISRPIRLEAVSSATIAAPTFVGAPAELRGLAFTEGLRIGLTTGVRLESLRVRGRAEEPALSVHGSEVEMTGVQVLGATEISSSTTTIRASAFDGLGARAALRADGARVTLRASEVRSGSYANVQLVGGSSLALDRVRLGPSAGTNLVALDGAQVRVDESWLDDAARFGLLVRGATVAVASSTISGAGDAAATFQGASVARMNQLMLDAGRDGAVLAHAFRNLRPRVRVTNSALSVVRGPGVVAAAGTVYVADCRLVGTGTVGAPHPAFIVRGAQARLDVRTSTVHHSSGLALHAEDDAGLAVHDLHVIAAAGPVAELVGLWQAPARLTRLRISESPGGTLRCLDSRAELDGLRMEGVASGLLAGEEAAVTLTAARIEARSVGASAFGDAVLQIQNSTVSGGRWSLFAPCGDESRVRVDSSVLRGPRALCSR